MLELNALRSYNIHSNWMSQFLDNGGKAKEADVRECYIEIEMSSDF